MHTHPLLVVYTVLVPDPKKGEVWKYGTVNH